MQKIGILGSGDVAKTLAGGFLQLGHTVMLGSRDPQKLAEWKLESGEQAHTGSFQEAAAFGDMLVLAVKGSAAQNALELAGADNLRGKIVIDTTNPIADAPPVNGVLQYSTSLGRSLMEDLQQAFPGTRLVKAFNSVGNAVMVHPDFGGEKPSMFICGNDESAKSEVRSILDRFGFETEDMGQVEAARAIEPLAMLWCIPGFRQNQWTHAFRLLKK